MLSKRISLILALLLSVAVWIQSDAIIRPHVATAQNKSVAAPEDVLGFRPGDDRKLASWAQVVQYFQRLAATSDRVKFAEVGKSTMGRPLVYATISAPENLKRLDEFKDIQRRLADPRTLGSQTNPVLADRRARALIARGKTVVAITCGIHSTEVGSYLSSLLIAYRLASSNEPDLQEISHNTIILLVPSTNPDGVDIVKNWYDKTLGTPYEGTDPPELYHKYTGHDDNRDWYAFTQVETRLVVDQILNVWHPQIVHDIHQQGSYGSRLFLPPYMPPVEPNVPKEIVAGYTELGRYLAKEMRADGFKGVTTDSTYDAWSPSRAYSHYHGGVRILSETASCKLATPITVKFDQLRPGEGYDPRKEAANFGPVWQGGEWHLRDITNHMTTAAFFLLKHAAQNRQHWLQRFYEIEKEAVQPRKTGELLAIIIPKATHRADVLEILFRAGVEIDDPLPFTADGVKYPDDTAVIKMSQPYAGFAKAVLEVQHYPDLRDNSGRPIPPYDVTAHTLSLLMNVAPVFVHRPFTYRVPKGRGFAGCDGGGPIERTVGLYKSHIANIDEGWTNWVLEHGRPFHLILHYSAIEDQEIRSANLASKYNVIIIPDQARGAILNGHRPGTMPPEYTGGVGAEGVKALREFVEQGGTLVCLNRASDFAIEQFKLPLRDVVDGLPRTDFYVPGSILRIELDPTDPLTAGMPKESIAWAENSPVFEIIAGSADVSSALSAKSAQSRTADGTSAFPAYAIPPANVHVIAWYPKDKDPLLSGWLLGGDRLKGKAALVEVGLGKGRIVLFGFRPQYRGQSLATYPLFFNAISIN